MSNPSLQEQLQAMASQLSNSVVKKPDSKSSALSTPKSPVTQKTSIASHKKPRPTEAAKKPKPKWLDFVQYGVELLKAYYPLCFKPASEVKPLKKGIKQDLVKGLSTLDDIVTEDKACMVKSLAYYVNTMAYHKSVIPGAVRIDLDGKPAGEVSQEEAQYSAERHQAKLQAKNQPPASKPQTNPTETVTEPEPS